MWTLPSRSRWETENLLMCVRFAPFTQINKISHRLMVNSRTFNPSISVQVRVGEQNKNAVVSVVAIRSGLLNQRGNQVLHRGFESHPQHNINCASITIGLVKLTLNQCYLRSSRRGRTKIKWCLGMFGSIPLTLGLRLIIWI